MRELVTVQTKEKLNKVFATDEKGSGGANHEYVIVCDTNTDKPVKVVINHQNGARNEENPKNGVLDCDLLEIVRDRLTSFQAGEFASQENAQALLCVEGALQWLNKRVEDRIARNVLGKEKK